MDYKEAIEKLKTIDLSSYPADEIRSLIVELGKVGVVVTTLHSGARILRGRINEDNRHFKTISDLSYKPQKYNTTYQRASTPEKTMFYGSIVPDIREEGEPFSARITTLLELSEFAREDNTFGTQKITFSVWEVVDDIHLVSLIHYNDFRKPTALSKVLQEGFLSFINKYPNLKESSLEIARFMGEQFAKPVESNKDYNYMISAIYSDLVTSNVVDGILYPSVRLDGEGINIALKPDLIGSKVKFLRAGECTLYKNGKEILLGGDTYASVDENDNLFFEKAPAEHFVSEHFGLNYVGIK